MTPREIGRYDPDKLSQLRTLDQAAASLLHGTGNYV